MDCRLISPFRSLRESDDSPDVNHGGIHAPGTEKGLTETLGWVQLAAHEFSFAQLKTPSRRCETHDDNV